MNKFTPIISLACLLLAACGSDNNTTSVTPPAPAPEPAPEPTQYEFKVTAINLTHGQPLSPLGAALHTSGQFWTIGEMASAELESLAEGGDNSGLLGLSVVNSSVSGAAPLGPGKTAELMLTTTSLTDQKLSLVTMMVNTNDGFTGLNSIDVSQMAVGDYAKMTTRAYDSGTEANSEQSGSMPGPADGGEGFNAERDDIDKVAMHPGVVGNDDGLSSSVLTSAHKFDNPLMAVTITRVK
ncbi:spondin domain-containing protein [Pseudoalteromonas sp. MMG013]|uniref:Spondin domain-containing protein n=1 Tax=Pseudoalteromonas aurantia 208 TaxID=1314867 RepID=A0ABR9EF66_9GAMM|nr:MULTISPECIES: spondin domain-containing protein [Pseudoalteromonas]MBE0368915.1 hypothetical protein [Pseudoalteromonas aurantia 208]MBQ4848135.1 spondin domain-containing protein [Pseudoalteromonas sp. MMG005]MBQ4863285.1 spondin domain-containing protein [Pseudoalteromonas sp. MMG013]